MFSFLALICTRICNILGETWQFLGSIVQLASSSEATVSSYEVSMWRSLWSDLFSQVVRCHINGFFLDVGGFIKDSYPDW
jgi:hypothetical protein